MPKVRASTQINNDNEFLNLDGSLAMGGELDFGSNKGINLAEPSANSDAARWIDVQDAESGANAYTDNALTDYLQLVGGTMTGDIAMGGNEVTGLPAIPGGDSHAVSKVYVDGIAQSIDIRESVRVATEQNYTDLATGAPSTVDGVSLSAGDRVLVKEQSTASENGIYTVNTVGTGSNGAWARSDDFDNDDDVTANAFFFVSEGSSLADTGWVLTTNDPITVGTTALAFTQFSGAGSFNAGTGIYKSGNTVSVGDYGSAVLSAAGYILVGRGSGAAASPEYMTGDVTMDGNAEVTVLTNGSVLESTGNGVRMQRTTEGHIPIAQGASDTVYTALGGDVDSVQGDGLVTMAEYGAGATKTVESTGSGLRIARYTAGYFPVTRGTGTDTQFVQMSGDVTMDSFGVTTLNVPAYTTNSYEMHEVPSGLINGSNSQWNTANAYVDGTERVLWNGIEQVKGVDYQRNSSTGIEFLGDVPQSGDSLIVHYLKA